MFRSIGSLCSLYGEILAQHEVRQVSIFQTFCVDFKLILLLLSEEGWVQRKRVLMSEEAALNTDCMWPSGASDISLLILLMSSLGLGLFFQQWISLPLPGTSGTFVLQIFQNCKKLEKQEWLQDIKCLLLLNEQMVLLPKAIILAIFYLCCHFLIAYFYCRVEKVCEAAASKVMVTG